MSMPSFISPDKVCFIPNIDAVSNLDKSVSAPVKKAAGLLKDFLGENTSEEADRHSIKQHEQSQHCQRQSVHTDAEEAYPLFAYILSCFTLVSLGFAALLNEIFRVRVRIENDREGYVPLYTWFELYYRNHLIRRVWSGMFNPIKSAPGPLMEVFERESDSQGWSIKVTSRTRKCINLGSYNYLNLSDVTSPCIPPCLETLEEFGVGLASLRTELGTTTIHKELEDELAKFIGVEDCLTFGMGFATNSLNIPSLMDSECLVLSDQFNHSSLILGIRLSGAKITVFNHNDMKDLEAKLRSAIVTANLRRKPWKKIFIIVEGVYSMHGSMAKLPEIIAIKEKYGAYLYLDEAHCMGAVGKNGKGVTQYFNIDPAKVDILMGTFAKSFGCLGGYICGSKTLVDLLRQRSIAHTYGTALPAVTARFILEGVKHLNYSQEGMERVQSLTRNTRYFRLRLEQIGFMISGELDSPVVPITITVGTLRYVVEYMREKNVAAVMVGYPASPVTEGRIRCCMNAHHTKEMIDYILECFEEIGQATFLRMSRKERSKEVIPY